MLSPFIDFPPSFIKRSEPMLVQTHVSEFPIQAFDEGILWEFPRLIKSKRQGIFL